MDPAVIRTMVAAGGHFGTAPISVHTKLIVIPNAPKPGSDVLDRLEQG